MAIRSMTGYGQASAELACGRLAVEVRSLNHRFAELRLRLPPALGPEEGEIRRKILDQVKRGRVELSVSFEAPAGGAESPRLDRAMLREVLGAAAALRDEFGLPGEARVETILAVPGLFQRTAPEPQWGAEDRQALARTLSEALSALDLERRREGEALRRELVARLAAMQHRVDEIGARAPALPALLRDRLVERLRALGPAVGLDPSRTAQEAAVLAERADVTEELVRLAAHIARARALVEHPDGEPVGKRLDFLVQEMHREANTVGGKCGDLELVEHVLGLKGEIEKVREQVQNVE